MKRQGAADTLNQSQSHPPDRTQELLSEVENLQARSQEQSDSIYSSTGGEKNGINSSISSFTALLFSGSSDAL